MRFCQRFRREIGSLVDEYRQEDLLLLHHYRLRVHRQRKSCLAGRIHYPAGSCLDFLHAIVVSEVVISRHQEWPLLGPVWNIVEGCHRKSHSTETE